MFEKIITRSLIEETTTSTSVCQVQRLLARRRRCVVLYSYAPWRYDITVLAFFQTERGTEDPVRESVSFHVS